MRACVGAQVASGVKLNLPLLIYFFTAFLLCVCVCVQAASGVKLNPFGNAAPRDEAAFQVTKLRPKAN